MQNRNRATPNREFHMPRRTFDGVKNTQTTNPISPNLPKATPTHVESVHSSINHSNPLTTPRQKIPTKANTTVHSVTQHLFEKPPKKRRTVSFLGIKTWADFRIFAAGALLATGLIGFGFYLGLSKPSLGLSPATTGAGITNQKRELAPNGEPLDAGVGSEETDPNPAPPTSPDMPKKIYIEKIGVNASVRSLGLANNGALAVPNSLWQVGWYNQSSKPGKPGTVLINGHYTSTYGGSAFKDLDKLEPGDSVKIQLGSDELIIYKVTKIEKFDRDKVPMDKLIATDSKQRLNVITVGGNQESGANAIDDRIVIYTERT